MKPKYFSRPHLDLIVIVLAAGMHSVQAADITLATTNASGTSGFNSGTGWPGAAAPTAGNAYYTGALMLRSPATDGSYTFAGDSLTVGGVGTSAAGRLLIKSFSTLNANYVLNGGMIHLAVDAGSSTATLAGTVNVLGSSYLGVTNTSTLKQVLDVSATMSGSANLQLGLTANTSFGGSSVTASSLIGTVRLSASNSYSGTMTLVGGATSAATGADGRLQLNNVNAVQNATVQVNTTTNTAPAITFLAASNTGAAYNIGALSTTAVNLALTDTAGAAANISVGSKAGSTTYGGAISGLGSIAKVGSSSTWILTNTNTYGGATSVTGGILEVGGTGSINNSSGITINGSGAKFLQTSSVANDRAITLTQGTLDGTGTVGAVSVGAAGAAADKVVANGNLGSNTALTLGSLAFDGSGNLSLRLGGTSSPGLIVTGGLTLSGGAGSIVVDPTVAGGLVNGSTYELISYGGSFTGASSDFSLASGILSGRQTGTFASTAPSAGFITLAVNGDNPVWSGAVSNVLVEYPLNNSLATGNLALKNGQTATDLWTGDAVEFNDTYNVGAGDVAVTNTAVNINGGATNAGGIAASTVTFNNSIVDYSLTSSDSTGITAGSLIKNGTGKVTISNANSYSGATSINAGQLNIQNSSALGATSGVIVAAGAALELEGTVAVDASPLILNGTGLAASPAGALRSVSGTNSYAGLVTLGSSATIQVDAGSLALTNLGTITGSGSTLTLDGAGTGSIASNIGTGAGALIKDGSGTWTVSGASTYTGGTTVNVGTLKVGGATALGGNAGAVSVTSGAVLDLNGTTMTGTNALTLNGTGISGSGALTNSSGTGATYAGLVSLGSDSTIVANSGDITLSNAGTIAGSGFNLTLDGTANGNIIAGSIGTGTGGLTKDGSGTWILTHTSTYTGATTINNGTLQLGNNGTNGGLNSATSVSIGSTGTLAYARSTGTSVSYAISGAGSVIVTDGGVPATGGATFSTTSVNSYTGGLFINSGTVKTNNNNGLGGDNNAVTLGSGASNATLTLTDSAITGLRGNITVAAGDGTRSLTTSGATVIATHADNTITLNKDLNVAVTDAAGVFTVNGVVSGTGGLTKTSAGTLTLSGANTYAGSTTISAGTLKLAATGSINSSTIINNATYDVSAVTGYTVGAGQTLTGSGMVIGDTTIAGTLAIGASPGTMTFNDDLTLGAGSISNFEFTAATFTVGSYDLALGGDGIQQANFDGTLNLFFDSGETYTNGSSVKIFDFESYDGDFADFSFSGLGLGQSATFDSNTGFVTVIPEPGAALLGGLGMLALLRRRR